MKRLLALLCSLALTLCLIPATAFAAGGNGNIDGGGGGMGQGTSTNFWNPGNDGVRITVVDAASGSAVSSPIDFSNRTQNSRILHFGKVNKLQYLAGTGLSLQSGVAYTCIKPTQSMPTIVSSSGQNNIDAIKRYFCSEYSCIGSPPVFVFPLQSRSVISVLMTLPLCISGKQIILLAILFSDHKDTLCLIIVSYR